MNYRTLILFLVLFGMTCCKLGEYFGEGAILQDSSVSLYSLNIHSDWDFISIVIVCQDGQVSYSFHATGWDYDKPPFEMSVDLPDYERLWQKLESQQIWELKQGEFWSVKERIKKGEWFFEPPEDFVEEDYRPEDIMMHYSLVLVEIRAGDRATGFARIQIPALKDNRYAEVMSAIYDVRDIREFLHGPKVQPAEKITK